MLFGFKIQKKKKNRECEVEKEIKFFSCTTGSLPMQRGYFHYKTCTNFSTKKKKPDDDMAFYCGLLDSSQTLINWQLTMCFTIEPELFCFNLLSYLQFMWKEAILVESKWEIGRISYWKPYRNLLN